MKQFLMIASFACVAIGVFAQPDKDPKSPNKDGKPKTAIKTVTNQKVSNAPVSVNTLNTGSKKNVADSTFKLGDLLKQYNLSAPPADTTLAFN